MLKTKERILLGLAALGDFVTEIKRVGGLMEHTMRLTYGWVPPQYRKGTYRVAVWRMLKTGDIERVVKDGEVYLRLTGQGVKRLVREFPLVKMQEKKWDNLWRIVIFDFPVTQNYKRNRLRKKLEKLGFGMFQKSVWMSPYNLAWEISEFLKAQSFRDYAYVLVSPLRFAASNKSLAEKIWKLNKIKDAYQKLLDWWEEKSQGLKGDDFFLLAQKFCFRYLEIVAADPFLPKELLPSRWPGEEARKIFQKLNRTIKKNQ
jgi:phenylacetic acid degradation operon negative regulatory protein